MGTAVRVIIHVFIFLAAILVFSFGTGLGLAVNSILGTGLWLVAGVIVVLNVLWILRWRRNKKGRDDSRPFGL